MLWVETPQQTFPAVSEWSLVTPQSLSLYCTLLENFICNVWFHPYHPNLIPIGILHSAHHRVQLCCEQDFYLFIKIVFTQHSSFSFIRSIIYVFYLQNRLFLNRLYSIGLFPPYQWCFTRFFFLCFFFAWARHRRWKSCAPFCQQNWPHRKLWD